MSKTMERLFCPKSGQVEWGNMSQKGRKLDPSLVRCAKCGERGHRKA